MGIKGLHKFLRDVCPNVFKPIHISQYQYKKIAVDISLYVYKFKTVFNERWLNAFIGMILSLRKNNIHPVFIYDTGSPIEKKEEREKRVEQKEKIGQKIASYDDAIDMYHKTGEVDKNLEDLYNKNSNSSKLLLTNTINISVVEDMVDRMRKQVVPIFDADFTNTKEICTALSIPWYDAPLEAETMCADLCKKGLVDAVLGEDSDIMAYESPVFLSKINTSSGECNEVLFPNILTELKLNSSEFLDFCILCGTDNNKNIPKIGPKNAYKLIQKHRSIEQIKESENIDISILNHIRVRELFKNYQVSEVTYVPYCGTPNYTEFENLRSKLKFGVTVDEIKEIYKMEIVLE